MRKIHRGWQGVGAIAVALATTAAGCGQAPAEQDHDAIGAAQQAVTGPLTCVTIQRGALGNVADAHIAPDKPASNWGSSNSLTAGAISASSSRLALMSFDLSPIPAGAVVTQATATLHVLLYGGSPVRAHRATAPWSEATVTYASFGNAYLPQVEATFPSTSTTSADLTALVQGWMSGAFPNDGILLERDLDGETVFASSEYQQAVRPSLDVCYLAPTCSDGVQNGGEAGVDCGGPCAPCDLCIGVTCAPPDQCHAAGTCDSTTGVCSYAPLADGTACDDGNACTTNDSCQAGACVGGSPVSCAPPGACQAAGVCDPTTGACSYAQAADGTACDDHDYCTTQDACHAGVCGGTAQGACSFPHGALLVAHEIACGTPGSCSHAISVVDQAGNTLKQFGNIASDDFRAHLALVGNQVYRTDEPYLHTLSRFDAAGNALPVATPTTSAQHWIIPIEVDQAGTSIYFLDVFAGSNVVRHLNNPLNFANSTVGVVGWPDWAGEIGDLFTGGPNNHTYALVQVYPTVGTYRVAELSSTGAILQTYYDSQFTVPYVFDVGSVVADKQGNVYVATTTQVVSVNAAGQHVGAFPLVDTKPSMAIDASGTIYVGHWASSNGLITLHSGSGASLGQINVAGAGRITDVVAIP